jgi:hypothetical protein
MSSIAFWNVFFHCGGMILRTGVLYRFIDFKALCAPVRAPANVLRDCCGKPKAHKAHLGTRWLF